MNAASPQKICSRIGLALFFMMLAWIACTVIIVVIAAIAHMSAGGDIWTIPFFENSWLLLALNDVPLYAIGLPVFLLVLRTIPNGPPEARPAPRPLHIGWLLLALAFCFGATYLFSTVTTLVTDAISGVAGLPASDMDGLLADMGFWEQFIFIACVPAVGEEFVFRYALRKKLRGAGDKTYIFFSAFCFGLFHGNFSQIFYAFVVGAVFAWLYLQTEKLWIPMLFHFCINFFAVLTGFVEENSPAWVILTVVIFALIILAIVLFVVFFRRVSRTFLPPSAPGWPVRGQSGRPYTAMQGAAPAPAGASPPLPAPGPVYEARPVRQPAAPYPPYPAQPPYPPYPAQPPPNVYPPQNVYPPPAYTGQPPAYYAAPGYAYYPPKPRGAVSLCLGNVGMILFMVFSGLMVLFSLFAM